MKNYCISQNLKKMNTSNKNVLTRKLYPNYASRMFYSWTAIHWGVIQEIILSKQCQYDIGPISNCCGAMAISMHTE
jgi:hypothetical protein